MGQGVAATSTAQIGMGWVEWVDVKERWRWEMRGEERGGEERRGGEEGRKEEGRTEDYGGTKHLLRCKAMSDDDE